jgi:hypothetical protein
MSFSLCMVKGNSAMQDYKVAKLFNIPFKVKTITPHLDVIWKPPLGKMVKFNCDGSSIGSHPCGSIGIVIRDSNHRFLGATLSNIGNATSVDAEFCAGMMAMERAQEMQLLHVCLETDSLKVVNAFHKGIGIPWQMRARWQNFFNIRSLGRETWWLML